MSKEIKYGYYSKVLNKPFDTIEELEKAELEYSKEQEKKVLAIEEKKELAHQIEDAYKSYIGAIEQGNKEIAEVQEKVRKDVANAKNSYIELKNNFIDKYGSYHISYNNKEAKVNSDETKEVNNLLDDVFDAFKLFPWF